MQECCNIQLNRVAVVCPKNGRVCRAVPQITVESLVRNEHKAELTSEPYAFCSSPDCDVVYVSASGNHLITKTHLRVRVGIKATADPIPLCYCFDFDEKAIREDIRLTGTTKIPELIAARVRAGECRCEVMNPSGTCCLGDVYRAVKRDWT